MSTAARQPADGTDPGPLRIPQGQRGPTFVY
jgi:hypothetical protein